MNSRPSTPPDAMSCAAFEERLPAWLEGQLEDAERAEMERHYADCPECATLVADLDGVVQGARALPVLTPARDLWAGIESRLSAPVIPLASRRDDLAVAASPGVAPVTRRTPGFRWFAVAATVLVAVSSGVTWSIARARFEQPSGNAGDVASAVVAPTASLSAAPASVSPSLVSPSPSSAVSSSVSPAASSAPSVAPSASPSARLASRTPDATGSAERGMPVRAASMADVDAIYEREIAALRQIVNRRFASLDTGTVSALRRNLQTIDQAIADSRRALERDPNSGVLSSELDRTLEAKLALMRRVALL